MALKYNGTNVENVYFNGTKLEKVYMNNTLVYESTQYINKPTVSGYYTFNNANQSAVITDYDAEQLIQGGVATAKSAGTYTVTFSLRKGYAWKDGTTADVSYTWTINKRSISIPTISTNSFTWVEGNTHSVSINGLDSSYVNQSGTTSQTDSSSNIGTNNTVTWSLKYASDTTWNDGTTANKTASWSVSWKDGTSHYKNDFYNRGWNSGQLGFDKHSRATMDIDYGSASKPYITMKNAASGTVGDAKSALYVKNSSYILSIKWDFAFADNAAHTARAEALLISTIGSGNVSSTKYGNSDAEVTATSGTIYGSSKGSSWPSDTSTLYPCLKNPTQSSSEVRELHITRIYHT